MKRRRKDRFIFLVAVALIWLVALFLFTVLDALEGARL